MAIDQHKITSADLAGKGNVGMPDTPGLSTRDMQKKLDELSLDVIAPKHNALVDALGSNEGASLIGTADGQSLESRIDTLVLESGAADMQKAVYDPGDTGVVSAAKNGSFRLAHEHEAALHFLRPECFVLALAETPFELDESGAAGGTLGKNYGWLKAEKTANGRYKASLGARDAFIPSSDATALFAPNSAAEQGLFLRAGTELFEAVGDSAPARTLESDAAFCRIDGEAKSASGALFYRVECFGELLFCAAESALRVFDFSLAEESLRLVARAGARYSDSPGGYADHSIDSLSALGDAYLNADYNCVVTAIDERPVCFELGGAFELYLARFDCEHLVFSAAADYEPGDFVVNGRRCAAVQPSGEPLEKRAFARGAEVDCLTNGGPLNFKRGGAFGAGFELVCASSLAALPTTAEPGAIGIVTARAAEFFAASPARDIASPKTGDVWIQTVERGVYEVNALKKNRVAFYPTKAEQYENGAWSQKTIYIRRANGWQPPVDYFYRNGTVYKGSSWRTYGTAPALFQLTAGYIQIGTMGGAGTAYVASTAGISLSNYRTLFIRCHNYLDNSSVTQAAYFTVAPTGSYSRPAALMQMRDAATTEYHLDVSALSGSYLVGVQVRVTGSGGSGYQRIYEFGVK